ncbi:MAG: hypothetical protein ABIU09_00725 [Pyrinomonadaceae bacterium]
MQVKKKRTETTSESVTLLIISNSASPAREDWCEECRADVFWIKHAALKLFGISCLPDPTAVHTKAGEFCARSLIERIKKEKIR